MITVKEKEKKIFCVFDLVICYLSVGFLFDLLIGLVEKCKNSESVIFFFLHLNWFSFKVSILFFESYFTLLFYTASFELLAPTRELATSGFSTSFPLKPLSKSND